MERLRSRSRPRCQEPRSPPRNLLRAIWEARKEAQPQGGVDPSTVSLWQVESEAGRLSELLLGAPVGGPGCWGSPSLSGIG